MLFPDDSDVEGVLSRVRAKFICLCVLACPRTQAHTRVCVCVLWVCVKNINKVHYFDKKSSIHLNKNTFRVKKLFLKQ